MAEEEEFEQAGLDTEHGDDATATAPVMPAIDPDENVPLEDVDPGFDLAGTETISFSAIEAGRARVYETARKLAAFRKQVAGMGDTGEEGRRKGLGLWMLAEFGAAEKQLAKYESDDVASYTRARALMTLGRHEEARPIFARLADAWPDNPKPRCGALEAALESLLAAEQDDDAAQELATALDGAPDGFRESAEFHYLAGRLAQLRGDAEKALDAYGRAHELDAAMRANLFHAAHLAERSGLDELALSYYQSLASLLPVDKNAVMNLGVLYEDLGCDAEAAACYDVVSRHDPTDARARLYLADAKAAMNMYYDEDLERKEDRLNQILRIPISDFELSVRARNCLNKMQINTLGDLVCRTEQELLSYKNFGETSLNEIKEILRSKHLRLGMPREEAVASIESNQSHTYTGNNSDLLNKPIHELQLSIRARRTVETLGCLTLGDVVKHSADELLGMPNFGVTSLQELKGKLAELGLKLRGD